MDNLIVDSYDYECVDDTEGSFKYDFVSLGEIEVPKRVLIQRYPNPGLERYFNLGFGNIHIDDAGIEHISDMSRNNNKGDSDKVLKTVFTCVLDFLSIDSHSKSIITFYGNTSAKHRLYKKSLNKNLISISKYFIIRGGVIQNLVTKENSGESKQVLSKINIETIKYEIYNTSNCNAYNFITLELRQ